MRVVEIQAESTFGSDISVLSASVLMEPKGAGWVHQVASVSFPSLSIFPSLPSEIGL